MAWKSIFNKVTIQRVSVLKALTAAEIDFRKGFAALSAEIEQHVQLLSNTVYYEVCLTA